MIISGKISKVFVMKPPRKEFTVKPDRNSLKLTCGIGRGWVNL